MFIIIIAFLRYDFYVAPVISKYYEFAENILDLFNINNGVVYFGAIFPTSVY